MLKLIRRWLGNDAPAAWDLAGYPPCDLPHPGWGVRLSEAQARQNWTYFQATLSARQLWLRDWLAHHHGPDPLALQGVAYARALNAWAKAHWQRLPAHRSLPAHPPWPACPRGGTFIVYSLLGDLAASLGETIRRANPDWHWGLNLDAIDLADDMHTARRVVLLADLTHPTPEAAEAVLDLEAMLFGAHRFPESVDFVHLDSWSRVVADAISGAYHQR